MEAASRPSRDPLPDLPLEEPAEGTTSAAARAAPAVAPAVAPKAAPPEADPAATQTLLKMEFIVGDGEMPIPAPPVVQAAPPDSQQLLEVDPNAPLSLEDTFEVDRMLSTPPAAAAPVAAAPSAPKPPEARTSVLDSTVTLTLLPDTSAASPEKPAAKSAPASAASPAATKTPAATETAPAAPTMVPLARRASLTAAAIKLAAASPAAPEAEPAPKPAKAAPPPAAVPIKPRPVTPTPKPAAAAPVTPAASSAPPAPPAATSPADAPSLASWANARAAASASTKPATAKPAAASSVRTGSSSTPTSAPSPAAERPRATPAAPAPAAAPAVQAAAQAAAQTAAAGVPARGMDRDFIARNQVVERYLSGKLPIKAATDFERYCKEHPKLLDEMGLPERVNAGLRLLEASGKPEPWQEAPKPVWQQPAVVFGIAGLAAALALALALVAMSGAGKTHKILELQRQVTDRTLDAATSTRVIRLMPSRSGASSSPAITIGGGEAQLVDFRIDESRSPYKDFRVTIDRVDQGRVMVIDNLTKDSNGHLRVAVNSSAFGPGNYQLTIEGLTMRLEPQPDSWVTIGIAQR
jgi:hypothetical protein